VLLAKLDALVPDFPGAIELLSGLRSTAGVVLEVAPYAMRNVLLFFFLLFVLRVLLRNQWIAALAFAGIFSVLGALGNEDRPWLDAILSFLYFGTGAVVVLRWGLLSYAVAHFVLTRTTFGRYVYAIGGNPDAALLVGIPVKWVTLKLFLLLAAMVAVASVVQVSRLNAGTNSLGTSMELYVIAAAVIGGVALSGGSGTVLGSVLGALIVQFLESGLLLLDVSIGYRMVIIGQVLIVAVVFDVLYRRASGERTT